MEAGKQAGARLIRTGKENKNMSALRFLWLVLSLCTSLAMAQAGRSAEEESAEFVGHIRSALRPLTQADDDYGPLIQAIGDARIVLLGEATHGSREFYRERARITRRLIVEEGFDAIVLEGDWVPLRRIDAYVRGRGSDPSGVDALLRIRRFPRWPWRNTEFQQFAEQLLAINAALPQPLRVAVYGMDLYAVPDAAREVIAYLDSVDPSAAAQARSRYRCFLRYENDPEAYGRNLAARKIRSCRTSAEMQFRELSRRMARSAGVPDEALFSAWQSARVVKSAEAYFRALYGKKTSSWNVRDRHMAQTIDAIMKQHVFSGRAGKVVVWAHNSHQGDARMTAHAAAGELSLGQLMRERFGERAVLVGFSTYSGSVRAATEWGGIDEVKILLPALPESFSALMHEAGTPEFLLMCRGVLEEKRDAERLERAVGVLYLPDSERESHYYPVRLTRQFDALIHIDTTTALDVLD